MMPGLNWMRAVVMGLAVLMMALFGCSTTKKNIVGEKAEAESSSSIDGYRIGPGDVIAISVWKNEDLTKVVKVLPDGNISFPLIGEMEVVDMTVEQLKETLKEKLARYSTADSPISVEVQQTNSLVIYIIGNVNRPGNFSFNGKINVLQALAMAGGLSSFAKGSDITILRMEKGNRSEFPFDYDAVTEGEHLEQNIFLKRGDVIVVP